MAASSIAGSEWNSLFNSGGSWSMSLSFCDQDCLLDEVFSSSIIPGFMGLALLLCSSLVESSSGS